MDYKAFLIELTGTENKVLYLACWVFAIIGVVLSYVRPVKRAIKFKVNCPNKFSIAFLIRDNWKPLILTIILIFLGLKFSNELAGEKMTSYYSLILGLGLDKLAYYLLSKTKRNETT